LPTTDDSAPISDIPFLFIMTSIGFLKNGNPESSLTSGVESFQKVVKSGKFSFYNSGSDREKNYLYLSRNDICLIVVGYVKNEDYKGKRTENILTALIDDYLIKGRSVFEGLDGSYILILWDSKKEILYVNRDIYGTKLLYYYRSPQGEIIFSDNLSVLIKVTKQRSLDLEALQEYLRFLDISPPFTLFKNMHLLQSDKLLIADGRRMELQDLDAQHHDGNNTTISFEKSVDNFSELLSSSIHERIRNSERVGVFLSGGIDSTLLCSLAVKATNNIKAFTVGFQDSTYDESEHARSIAEYLGMEHEIFKFSIHEDYMAFNDFVSNTPSIFADPAVIPTFQCFKKVRDRADVIMDGTGADSFIGMMPARHIRFILQYARHIPLRVRLFFAGILKKTEKLSSYHDLFDFGEAEDLLIRWKGWTKEEISTLMETPCDLSRTNFYRVFEANSALSPYELYRKLLGCMPDDRLHQLAGQLQLNITFPFWDRSIRQFGKNLPLRYKYDKGTSKILFRKVLEQHISPSLWDKPKHGFDYPFENLLRYDNYKLLRTYFDHNALRDHGLFDISFVERNLQRFYNGDSSVKFKIWALAIFQAWYFNYFKNL
jgi:asparagine synthase (glutamine-hydrolysing)